MSAYADILDIDGFTVVGSRQMLLQTYVPMEEPFTGSA